MSNVDTARTLILALARTAKTSAKNPVKVKFRAPRILIHDFPHYIPATRVSKRVGVGGFTAVVYNIVDLGLVKISRRGGLDKFEAAGVQSTVKHEVRQAECI